MDAARLKLHSRIDSQRDDHASDYQSSDDNYDYNTVDDALEAQPTKAIEFHPAKIPQAPYVRRASRELEDADNAFTETMTHIWQRHAGGRRAKIPDVNLDLETGISDGATKNKSKPPRAAPEVKNIKLRWNLPEIKGRRVLQLDSGKPDLEVPDYLQRHRVRWLHSKRDVMQLDAFEKLANECQLQPPAIGERGLTHRLLKRVRTLAEREFVGGKFLTPLALRYDNQDVSRYTVDKTCIFFSFPYFLVAKPALRKYFAKEDPRHPVRTLLQSHYRFNKTLDRDSDQSISMLKGDTIVNSINASEGGRNGQSMLAVEDLVFVPQVWGIIDGLDTLVSNGPIDEIALQGPAMTVADGITRPDGYALSLVRISFTYQNRREDLIYPVIHCDSWFGLLNKKQQILEVLGTPRDKPHPRDYRFWLDERQPITIRNWSILLSKSRSTEILTIWMKKETPTVHVHSTEGHRKTVRQPAFSNTDGDVPESPENVPVVSAFFAWDILDELGEADKVSLPDRVGKFLNAIYYCVKAEAKIRVEEKSEDQIQDHLIKKLKDPLALELLQSFQLLFQYYVPEGQRTNTSSQPIAMYWGAVYEITETFAETTSLGPTLREYSTMVSSIVFRAKCLHQGVYCSRAVHDPMTDTWRYDDAVAKGTILLAVIVDALGAIFQMIVETVRCLREKADEESVDIMGPDSKVIPHYKDACKLLQEAKDQMVKEADGRDKNGNIGPVVTPEAITIALLERLASGVLRNGTIDIIHLYEECLEYLTLKVKNEASRRLLQRLNGFQEEMTVVKTVIKEQDNVLSDLRAALNPKTFSTPTITRKLRYNFECKAIDRITNKLREQMRDCDELMERAKSLAIQNVQPLASFQDDNNKAIFIFTIVTVLFLPMSFAASFFGMNVYGHPQKHFWIIALPFTFVIVILCTIVAFKGEEVYISIARMGCGLKRLCLKADWTFIAEEQLNLSEHGSVSEVEGTSPPAEELHDPMSGDDTDTLYAESSYQLSLSSFGSTRPSLDSIATPWMKVTELKAMFATDVRFNSLCKTAIESPGIGIQRLERNLGRLIRHFATALRKEAAVDDMAGRAAARFIGFQARRLAMEIVRFFISKETIKEEIDYARLSERFQHRNAYQLSYVGLANDISSEDDADSVNNIEDEADEDSKEDISNIIQLKVFILSSNAFENLRWGLNRFLQPDVLQAISKEMGLETNSEGRHTVTFHVYWNLLNFCEEELEGNWDLATVLTVTGTGKTAFATTCQEYVVRHWPKTGQAVLTFLESAIRHKTHHSRISPKLYISMDLNAWYSPEKKESAKIYASGSHHDLVHIAQQLAWISAVFRVPRDGELTYSDVVFEKRGHLEYNILLMDLQKVKNTNKYCWHSLFANTVIARGFTIPNRESEIGVEIPFEVMMSLACILYPLDYHGGTILRGVKLTLVPTAHYTGSVQWHCISSEQDSYLPRASQVMKQLPEWFKTNDFELLQNARTFLGYCRIAEIHLGTSGTDYKSIQKSDAKSERTRALWSREFSATVGTSAKGIITATLSPKVTFSRRLRATTKQLDLFFQDRVLRARDQPSILYDVEKKTGWLVPELSVVLHIAHAWASQQPDISAEVLREIPHAVASGDGGAAAWDAILKSQDVELRKGSIDGKPQLFGHVIKNVLTALENRKDVAVERDTSFFNVQFPTRSGLRGWELVDLAKWSYSSERKEVDVDRKTAGEWGSIAAENPELVVLFCKGIVHPIRPAKHQVMCRSWTPIPEGRCYLMASVHCLKKLSENCGGTESCPKLTGHLHWHRPRGATLFEGCNYGAGNRCNPLQELMVKKKAFTPGVLEPHGAVIFGRMSQAMTTCCEPFETANEGPLNDTTSMNGSPHRAENSSLAVPTAEFGLISSPQIRRNNDDSSYTGRRQRISVHGTPQNSDPIATLPLVNGSRTLRVRPGYDNLKKIRHFDTLDQQREPTK